MADDDNTDTKASFRAKVYDNRKGEHRLQVSGLQADFVKLAKGDEPTLEVFRKTLVEGLKAK